MRILLTGKNGQLGRCFQDVLKNTNYKLFAYGSAELNIADASLLAAIVQQVKPDIIVNAAAYTAVDKAETDADNAYLVNATGPELLAKQAAILGIPLIHVSTDYVFDGAAVEPYLPSDETNPQGVYGASKLVGERAVKAACEKHIILRTAWVFSEYGNNFVKTMVRLAKERDELSVVADQYGCPTYAGDLAKAILHICEQHDHGKVLTWGIYHYCGDTPTSWHGFARAIFYRAEALGVIDKSPQLKAISSDLYPTPAKRPEYSVMSTELLSRIELDASFWMAGLFSVLSKLK
ncbi:dTDP-4-dehydrorhamnose reductase [Marinomonas sp. ef1]|uniref:dTDP-4-dehydrorhamnose reductase n=1 Tax=Marinomonas sp. ef1 TaxID=2005043 RepID=UPI000C28C0B8|nr:dTDP-4-dehydrorhamnose reductase [Marinomonas sp. ef1]|tara:strand:- start:63067 stop:63942 length:876 start_codon:yes stop_codon:yes gene_type:complete